MSEGVCDAFGACDMPGVACPVVEGEGEGVTRNLASCSSNWRIVSSLSSTSFVSEISVSGGANTPSIMWSEHFVVNDAGQFAR